MGELYHRLKDGRNYTIDGRMGEIILDGGSSSSSRDGRNYTILDGRMGEIIL